MGLRLLRPLLTSARSPLRLLESALRHRFCVAASFARGKVAAPSCAWALFNQQTLLVHRASRFRRHAGQISPNKNMRFRCTIAAFTLSAGSLGLRCVVRTRPQTEPSMRFVFLGSHLCSPASFRPVLTDLPLPSASGYPDVIESSHRGLLPHKLMPMSGVHRAVEDDASVARTRISPRSRPRAIKSELRCD